jgi:branched-chain amino acid aminotransferase
VLELAAREGVAAEERTLDRVDLLGADEVFLTGTGARIVPVGSLDRQTIGNGSHPTTERLSALFAAFAPTVGTPL